MSDQQIQKHASLQQVPLKTLEKIHLFKRTGNIFIYKKSERIMAATFAVSDTVESRTLREEIRAEALSLFSGVRDAIAAHGTVSSVDGGRLSLRALSLTALLEVSCRLGEISEGNYSLLRGELTKLAESLSQAQEDTDGSIDRRILEDGLGDRPRRSAVRPASPRVDSRSFETGGAAPSPSETRTAAQPRPVGEAMTFRGTMSEMMEAISDSIKDRENAVLEIVRKRGKVSIKEVAGDMPLVGEKTLQRTLSSLVSGGTLKKTGDRRWSRYELASAA